MVGRWTRGYDQSVWGMVWKGPSTEQRVFMLVVGRTLHLVGSKEVGILGGLRFRITVYSGLRMRSNVVSGCLRVTQEIHAVL